MKLIYIDESGYEYNWIKNVDKIPYHVVSAFSIDVSMYRGSIDKLIKSLDTIKFEALLQKFQK